MQLSQVFLSRPTFITVVEQSYLQDTIRGNMGAATPPGPGIAESRRYNSIASLDNNIN